MRRGVRCSAALALLAAGPALAYLLPVSAVLKRVGQRRDELGLASLEARGTFVMTGESARAAAAATGLPLAGSEFSVPALLTLKVPGRCRLDLAPPDLPEADRPAAVVKQGRLSGVRSLDRVGPAAALLRGLCALLSQRPGGPEPDRPYAEELARLGVPLTDVALGRFAGRVAYVFGARPAETKPQAWVDKLTFQPMRVIFAAGPGLSDVRFLEWGSPTGGEWFPRVVEVYEGADLRARFVTERAAANPKVSDALF